MSSLSFSDALRSPRGVRFEGQKIHGAHTDLLFSPGTHSFRLVCPSALEAPASRTVRLCGGDTEGGMEGEAVALPGRWSGARGAVRRRERFALHLGRPATL